MPLDPKKARTQSAQLDRDIGRRVEAFTDALADAWGAVRRRIVVLTDALDAEQGRLQSTAVNLGAARKIASELQRELAARGVGDLIQGAVDDMGDLAKYRGIGQTTVRRVEAATAWSAGNLEAFRTLKLAELADIPDTVVRQVERVILNGIVSAQSRSTLINELTDLLDTSLPKATTLYDTALSEYSRLVVTATARGTSDEAFLFDGPIDAKLRPFCAERVGKVFTRAEIDAMDNGQLPNTLISGGGYNCRHTWIPLDEQDTLNAKANTGEYADPLYAEDLANAQRVAGLKGGR